MKCPNCESELTPPEGRDVFFCMFCGKRFTSTEAAEIILEHEELIKRLNALLSALAEKRHRENLCYESLCYVPVYPDEDEDDDNTRW